MKLLLAFVLTTIPFVTAPAQKLIKNEVDEFTRDRIKTTSFEPLCQTFNLVAKVSARSINDSLYFFRLKIALGSGRVHSIERDATFFLKLADESIVELHNNEYTLSCTGCGSTGFVGSGAQGSETVYMINEDQRNKLLASKLSKIRIYTSQGYAECNIRSERAVVIQNELLLLKGVKIQNDDY